MRWFKHEVVVILGGQITQLALTFVTGVLIARSLGPRDYGVFNLLRNSLMMLLIVAPLGLDISLLKFCGKANLDDPLMRGAVRVLRLGAAICNFSVALIIGVGLSGYIMRNFYPYAGFDKLLALTMLALPLSADILIVGALYKARGQAATYSVLAIYLQSALRFILVCLAMIGSPTLLTFVSINVGQVVASSLALFLNDRRFTLARGGPPPAPFRTAAREARTILSESLWMALSVVAYGMIRFVDVLMLGAFASAKDVGEYAALNAICQLVPVYAFSTSQSLGPRVSKLYHEGDSQGVADELTRYMGHASIVSGFIFGGIAVFGDRLDLLFGSKYAFSPLVSFLMPAGYLISAILGPTGLALSMTGRHREELAILTLGALLLLALGPLLIPSFGQAGVATAVLVTYAITNILRFAYVRKTLRLALGKMRDFIPPLAALVVAYAARRLGDAVLERSLLSTIISCILYALAFGALAYATMLDPERRQKLKTFVTRVS
ncbi:MAG: oligosaccharide flippase family protein [Methylocystis sp.]